MNNRTTKIVYWIFATLTSLCFAASGICELTKNPLVWVSTLKLGYPPHFIYLLGVAKVSGVVVMMIPNKLLRLKEWVFAGLYFDVIFAFFSKIAVLGLSTTIDTIIAFTSISITYWMFRKLYPATYSRGARS